MFALVALIAAVSPLPQLAVVHDDERSLDDARAVTARLNSSGKVLATLREIPLSASCTRTSACVDRPAAADALVAVSRGMTSTLHVELLAMNGATLASEVVEVADPALRDAALAPALARIADAAAAAGARVGAARSGAQTTGTTSSAGAPLPPPDAGGDNAWVPWVLGTGAVCGGVCLLAMGGAVVYAMVVSAQQAGNAAGNACGDSLNKACTAPLDACSGIGDAFGSIGDSCSGVGDSCSGAGDSLGSACDGIGNVGSCAVMPAALSLAAQEPGDPRPLSSTSSPRGAMAY